MNARTVTRESVPIRLALRGAVLAAAVVGGMGPPIAAQDDPDMFRIINDYPVEENPGWHEDVQGVTHDDSHWFITQTTSLWKIPVSHDLAVDASDNPDTRSTTLLLVPDLLLNGYDHFGDPACHRERTAPRPRSGRPASSAPLRHHLPGCRRWH